MEDGWGNGLGVYYDVYCHYDLKTGMQVCRGATQTPVVIIMNYAETEILPIAESNNIDLCSIKMECQLKDTLHSVVNKTWLDNLYDCKEQCFKSYE